MPGDFFHLTFVVVFVAFALIRAYYFRLAARSAGPLQLKEGRLHIALRAGFGIPFIVSLFTYMFRPDLFDWAHINLPAWSQWLGFALGVACLPLILWVQWALGSNFSTTLHVRDNHTLVTHGPYRWVRHPMYSVLFMLCVAILLLTQNWLIGGVPLLALSLIVVLRVRNEEALMTEKFGEQYRDYSDRSGRFFPRLSGNG